MSREAFVKLVVVPLAFLAILAGIIWYWTARRIRIVNDADFPLDNFVLDVKTRAGGASNVVLRREIDAFKPGQSTTCFFREDNFTVRLDFKLNGRPHEFEQSTNLFAGVIWELYIDSNGSVKSSKSFFFD